MPSDLIRGGIRFCVGSRSKILKERMIFSPNAHTLGSSPRACFGGSCARGTGMADPKNRLTYADAGVDIDAGNRLVDLIKPMVRATARAGPDAEIGGFWGHCPLKAAGITAAV